MVILLETENNPKHQEIMRLTPDPTRVFLSLLRTAPKFSIKLITIVWSARRAPRRLTWLYSHKFEGIFETDGLLSLRNWVVLVRQLFSYSDMTLDYFLWSFWAACLNFKGHI